MSSRLAVSVKGLRWLGVRTANAEAMSAFYRDVLKLEVLREQPHDSRFALTDGTEVHVYGDEDRFHRFFGTAPVIGFFVDSFAETHERMTRAGVEFLYPEPQREAGRAWQHFRAPDGNVYEIIGKDDLEERAGEDEFSKA
jgi:catechol 2,3-dioxygenase-like lactoylglutathione lyase family enzyme